MLFRSISEVLGGLTRKEIEDRKARGYRKAAAVLGDPNDLPKPKLQKVGQKANQPKRRIKEEALDELSIISPKTVNKVVRTGSKAAAVATAVAKHPVLAAKVAGERISRATKLAKRLIQHNARKKDAEKRLSQSSSPFPQDMHQTQQANPTSDTGNGVVRRNWNTLMGRDADYKPQSQSKTGRGGRLVRNVVGGTLNFADRALSSAMGGALEETTRRNPLIGNKKIIKVRKRINNPNETH